MSFKIGDKVKIVDEAGNPAARRGKKLEGGLTVCEVRPGHFRAAELLESFPNHSLRNERAVLVASAAQGEQDPKGLSASAPGAKLDAGKVMAAQILAQFPRALMGVAEVGTFGANKYSLGGWQHVENGFGRYEDAQFRHYLKRNMGEKLDPESKLDHLKHEAWNALAKLELYLREQE